MFTISVSVALDRPVELKRSTGDVAEEVMVTVDSAELEVGATSPGLSVAQVYI